MLPRYSILFIKEVKNKKNNNISWRNVNKYVHYNRFISEFEQRIVCYKTDTTLAVQHKPQGEEMFCPMTLRGISYTEKAAAGEMLLAIFKEYPFSAPIEIGSYRCFKMENFYDKVGTHYYLNLTGKQNTRWN